MSEQESLGISIDEGFIPNKVKKAVNNNFPAFPFEYVNQTRVPQKSFVTETMIPPNGAEQYSGMTMRDYFAAKAMQTLILVTKDMNNINPHDIATESYTHADAMLAERSKQ